MQESNRKYWRFLHKNTNGNKDRCEYTRYLSQPQIRLRNELLKNKSSIENFTKMLGLEIGRAEISYSGSIYFQCWSEIENEYPFVIRISDHMAYGGDRCIVNITNFNGVFYPNAVMLNEAKQRLAEIRGGEELKIQKKQKLIEALKEEKQMLLEKGLFSFEHDEVLDYLQYEIVPDDPQGELLEAAMYDYETLLSDYTK